MTARTHDAIAFTSLVAVTIYFTPMELNFYTLVATSIGCIIGGMIPDIDQAGNRLWDFIPAGNTLGKYLRKIFYKHRTITHSIIGIFLIYTFFNWILPVVFNSSVINPKILLTGIMIGVISHIIADSLTEEGVPLLFPFKFKFGIPPISSWRIKTGGWFETLIVLPVIFVVFVLLIDYNREKVLEILQKMIGN